MPLIALAFFVLAGFNNWQCLRYILSDPSVFDWASAKWIVAQGLVPIAEAVLIILALRGMGFLVLRRILASEMPVGKSAQRAIVEGMAFGLGLGIAGSVVFLLGLAGLLSSWTLLALGILSALLALPEYRGLARVRLKIPRSHFALWKAACPTLCVGLVAGCEITWACAALLVYAAWHVLILALAPPTEWDVLAYHLAIPKLYWARGGIQEIPWLVHSHWPHLMETLYVVPLALGHDNLAALLHASACLALAICVFGIAKKQWGDKSAWISAALITVQPIPLRFAGTAHCDGALALFFFLASLSLWNWSANGSRRWLVLGGIFAGFCAGAKLHGLVLMTLLAVQVAYVSLKLRKGWKEALKAAILFFASGFIIVSPWYLKTWFGTGNPVWPFFPGIFGDQWGASAVTAMPTHAGSWRWLMHSDLLFHDGPQFLAVPASALFLLAVCKQRRPVPGLLRFLAMPMLPYLAMVSIGDTAWRHFWPLYPALALAGGWSMVELWRGAGRFLKGFALLILGFGLSPAVLATQNNQLYEVLGLKSMLDPDNDPRSVYLERSLGIYRFCQEVNRTFPGAKVLLFQEIRGYYLDADYMWGDPTNQGVIRYSEMRDSRQLGQELLRLGITYVWVNKGLGMYRVSPDYYTPHTMGLMEGLLRSNARPVIQNGMNTLYELHG